MTSRENFYIVFFSFGETKVLFFRAVAAEPEMITVVVVVVVTAATKVAAAAVAAEVQDL